MPVAIYPATVVSFPERVDITDTIFAAHINMLQLEVAAIETILGTNPQASAATVKARIAAVETSIAALNTAMSTVAHLSDLTSINAALPTFAHLSGAETLHGLKTFADGLIVSGGNGQASSIADVGTDAGTRSDSTSWATTLDGSGTAIDTTFIAPPSGRVMLLLFARIGASAAGVSGWFSSRVRGNPTGTIISDFDTDHAVYHGPTATGQVSGCCPRGVSGLTSGATYRLQGGFRSTGGTTTFDSFGLAILPSLTA